MSYNKASVYNPADSKKLIQRIVSILVIDYP